MKAHEVEEGDKRAEKDESSKHRWRTFVVGAIAVYRRVCRGETELWRLTAAVHDKAEPAGAKAST